MHHKNEDCIAYCGEEAGEMSQTCLNHAAHTGCIVGSIYQSMEAFADSNRLFWLGNFISVRRTLYRAQSGLLDRVVHLIHFAKEALPKCAGCRTHLTGGEIEIAIEDMALPGRFTPADLKLKTRSEMRG